MGTLRLAPKPIILQNKYFSTGPLIPPSRSPTCPPSTRCRSINRIRYGRFDLALRDVVDNCPEACQSDPAAFKQVNKTTKATKSMSLTANKQGTKTLKNCKHLLRITPAPSHPPVSLSYILLHIVVHPLHTLLDITSCNTIDVQCVLARGGSYVKGLIPAGSFFTLQRVS